MLVVLAALMAAPHGQQPPQDDGTLARPPLGDLCRRAFHLALSLAPLLLSGPAALLHPPLAPLHHAALLRALEQSGAVFIKWGQWASTRPDLLPSELCFTLSKLHSSAPSHPFEVSRVQVEAALRAPLEHYFDTFEEAPSASGSIGQVHFATRQGQRLAVKVRHPNVELELRTDFYLMSLLAALVDAVPAMAWVDAPSTVRQFGTTLAAQLSLSDEGANLRAMGRHFRAWPDVRVPRVLLSTPAVLIEERVGGEPVSRFTAGAGPSLLAPRQRHYIVRRGCDIYLKMLLVDNLMHADMHPGNILYDPARGELALVDLGLVAVLSDEERASFIGLLRAMGDGDGHRAAAAVLGFAPRQGCVDARGFSRAMAALFAERCRGYGTGINFGEVLRSVLALVRRYRVSIGANYMTLVVNALCLEGMARALEPEYNVLDGARALLVAHGTLPQPVFFSLLPALQLAKRAHDSGVAWRLRRAERRAREGTPRSDRLYRYD